MSYKDHLIYEGSSIKTALIRLNSLAKDAILFVVNENDQLIGSLTDGDVRRGLLKNIPIEHSINKIIQPRPKYIKKGDRNINNIISYRENNFKIIPVINNDKKVVNVINFRFLKSYLPVDAIIMAGGKGKRLAPLTDTIPKPLLKVADKPIMEHNVDRLVSFGIDDFWFSVNYLSEQIKEYFGNGISKNINIEYINEKKPLGTIGAARKIKNFKHDYILVTNSDILTNLDYENFFLDFVEKNADFSLMSIPYNVSIPYAVLKISDGTVLDLKEKPTHTYYTNGGIYLMKKEILSYIPKDKFFNATDLIELLIKNNKKVICYSFSGYWLDVGKHDDYKKAQDDIKILKN